MKKHLLTSLLLLAGMLSFAQYSSKGFSFQGYAVDPDGKAMASVGITVKFTLSTATNTNVAYVEEQALTTDGFGVFSATIGTGTVTTDSKIPFAAMNFNLYLYKLKVEVKKTSGGSYTTLSDENLNAVPYARSAENGVPVGTIVAFGGDITKLPAGWALCNGATIDGSTPQYKALFDAIGTAWGGSGTSVNLPDLRGVFLRGVNDTRSDGFADPNAATRTASNTGGNTGNKVGTVQADDFEAHNHAVSDPGHAHGISDPGHSHGITSSSSDSNGSSNDYGDNNSRTNNTHSATTGISVNNASTGVSIQNRGGSESRPSNAAVHYIIKL